MDASHTPWRVETRTKASSAFAIVATLIILAAIFAPLFISRGMLQDLFFILTMLTMAQSWNLLAGYAGLVSVGQQAFVGFGAYAMFACVILLGLDPLVSILIAGVAAALLAIPTGFFVFRLQGAYFAIGTWVIAEVVRLSLAQWKALGGGTGTSLPTGTTRDMIGVGAVGDLFGMRPAQAADVVCYWLALLLAVATIGFVYRLLRSRQGLALAAVRDNQEAARSVGVDPKRLKALVFLLTAFGTGLCGGLIFIQITRVTPDAAFSVVDWTAFVIFVVVIGGVGTLPGPIVGVVVFYLLQKFLADYGTLYLIALGLLGIAVMLFAPRGLWGSFVDRTGLDPLSLRHRAPRALRATAPVAPTQTTHA